MTKTVLGSLLCALCGWMLTACSSEEEMLISEGKGAVRLSLSASVGFKAQTKAVDEKAYEDVDNYTVQLLKDGTLYNNFSFRYNQIPEFTEVENGTYTLKAFYGDETKSVYTDDLCFSGSENITIKNDTANVEIKCKPNSARLNVVFDEKMDTYFSDYRVEVSTIAQDKSIFPWDKETVGPVYFKVQEKESVKFKILLTRKNANSTLPSTISKEYTLSPADAFKLNVAPSISNGTLNGITITIDETVIDHPVEIEIPSDWV